MKTKEKIMYLIPLGQLKRIIETVNRNLYGKPITLESFQYILRGKGELIPVWLEKRKSIRLSEISKKNIPLFINEKENDLKYIVALLNGHNCLNPR